MSKVYIADKNNQIDAAYETLVRHIDSKYPIVMISYLDDFVFNEELLSLKPKEFIVVDFIEMGWDYDYSNHTLENYYKRFKGEEWKKYHDWAVNSQPLLCFKRELDRETAKIPGYYPIDYPATTEPIPIQSEAEFNSRPVSACYYFGRSHEARLALHSDIWRGATTYGYSVCDNPYQVWGNPEQGLGSFLVNEKGKKYISMHTPHWFRLPMTTILQINGLAKIGIAPFGAGQKTFRATEVSANSVMLMWEDDMAWSYEWVHGFNCIKCKPGQEVATIEKWTQDSRLYSIYLEGVKTWEKYRTENYIQNYLMPLINNA